MRVDTVLTDLLEATAAKTAASRRIDRLRDVLDREARRRYDAEGAAPSWKAPKLGAVRLDPKPAKAYVSDPDAFASYVAQRHPSEVTARIELDAAQLEAALSALEFAGVTVTRSAVEVRPQFAENLLATADVLYHVAEDGTVTKAVGRVEPTSGELELVAGADVLPPSASLVVTLDRDRKRAELERVDLELEDELNDAAEVGAYLAEADRLDAGAHAVLRDAEAAADRTEAEEHAAAIGDRLIALAGSSDDAENLREAAAAERLIEQGIAATNALAASESAHLDDADPAADPRYSITTSGDLDAGTVDVRLDVALPADAITPGSEIRTPPELEPVASLPAPPDPDPATVARVNAAAGAPVEPVPGVVDELVKLSSDDLKRAARSARVPLNGTKVLLAGRLARAGVTVDDVIALRPA